ncbi:RrF2 family transcriptional regulator [Saccharicrinis sp. FJH54]|uniref:RrF2 family transcriptional regulator n=1 Tax=Saccharicrinis sp. FJH54 TaxID=3344665 RepID=UPI0035D526B0
MTFNKTTTYALMILTHMAKHPDMNVSATMLSKDLHIPLQYCRRILTDLTNKDLLRSIHGRKGGFVLVKPSKEIYISEIVEAFEGFTNVHRCIMGFENCPVEKGSHCVLHTSFDSARKQFISILKNTTLDNFILDDKLIS